MSTLKIVLHVQKTLKTTIQKNLSKSHKFARKMSVAEFRYSQRAKRNEQQAKRNKQRTKSNEQRGKKCNDEK